MKKIILSICFVFSTYLMYAQSAPAFSWAKNIGGSSSDILSSMVTDAAGNVYTVGKFYGTVDFNPSPTQTLNLSSLGDYDAFVTKMDPLGNLVWARRFGNTITDAAYSIAVDASGNVYVGGTFDGTVDFDPSSTETFNLTAINNGDIFIVKLNSSGNLIKALQLGSASSEVPYAMKIDASGNVYVTGYFAGSLDMDPGAGYYTLYGAGSYDVFVLKLDASGNFVWAKGVGGTSSDVGRSIVLDALGNVIVTGNFYSTADFDPDGATVFNLTSAGDQDAFILKLSSTGSLVWAENIGGTSSDNGNSLAVDDAGNIYLAGSYFAQADFNPSATSTYNMTPVGNGDGYVAKYDVNGAFIWAKNIGGSSNDGVGGLVLDASGNLYVTGSFSATVDFDPLPATVVNLTSAGASDVYIMKMSPSGSLNWARNMGGTLADYSFAIAEHATNIIVAGYYNGTSDFNPDAGTYSLSSSGNTDVFVVKLGQCSPPSAPTITGKSICAGQTVSLSATGVGTIGWYSSASGRSYLGGGVDFTTPALTSTTIYYVQDSTCTFSVRKAVTVTVNELPIVEINGDQIICNGTSATLSASGAVTYVWSTGSNEADAIVSPVITTTYTVEGTDINSCVNNAQYIVTVEECTTTGIFSGIAQSSMNVYPNPVLNECQIETNKKIDKVVITDAYGKYVNEIHSPESRTIHVDELNSGVYFFTVICGETFDVIKVVKQ